MRIALIMRGARQECGQEGTTRFYNFLTDLTPFIKKIVLCGSILAYILAQTNAGKLFYLILCVCKQRDSLDDSARINSKKMKTGCRKTRHPVGLFSNSDL